MSNRIVHGHGSREWVWSADLDKLHRARIGYMPPDWRESLREIVKASPDKPSGDIRLDGILHVTDDPLRGDPRVPPLGVKRSL